MLTQEEFDLRRLRDLESANQLGEKNYNLQKGMGIADLGMQGLGSVLNIYGAWQDQKEGRKNRREQLRMMNDARIRQMRQDQQAQEQLDYSNAQTGQQGALSLSDEMLNRYSTFGA